MTPLASDESSLDPHVVEQAMLWMVRLQSGVSSAGEQLACQRWRQESPAHEQAWQRLNGIGQCLRDGTCGLSAGNVRGLLQARALTSRRALLKGFAGAGVLIASGYGVSQRSLMPTLFSDYGTSTGERRSLSIDSGVAVQLDTRSALDSEFAAGLRVLTLNQGRMLLTLQQGAQVALRTADVWVRPQPLSRLLVSQEHSATLVQLLDGGARVEQPHGQHFELRAGWQQRFSGSLAGALAPLPAGAAAWTQGLLLAERLPLGQLLTELDRYRSGVLRCDPRIANLQVSGAFSVDQPEASLDLLTQVLPIRVQRVFGYWASVVPA